VTTNLRTSAVSLFINNGDGSFRDGSDYSVQKGPIKVVAGDLDGDKDVDLAVLCFSASAVSILLNRGKGSFVVASKYDITGSPADLCSGDFNGDGKIDLVTANSNSLNLSILLNKGNGTFAKDVSILYLTNHSVSCVVILTKTQRLIWRLLETKILMCF